MVNTLLQLTKLTKANTPTSMQTQKKQAFSHTLPHATNIHLMSHYIEKPSSFERNIKINYKIRELYRISFENLED